MLQNLIICSKYWKVWKKKRTLKIILMKNGKNIKTIIKETIQQLIGRGESTETLKKQMAQ